MGYNKFIYYELINEICYEGGFEGNFIKICKMIIALKYVHIARRFHYKVE